MVSVWYHPLLESRAVHVRHEFTKQLALWCPMPLSCDAAWAMCIQCVSIFHECSREAPLSVKE